MQLAYSALLTPLAILRGGVVSDDTCDTRRPAQGVHHHHHGPHVTPQLIDPAAADPSSSDRCATEMAVTPLHRIFTYRRCRHPSLHHHRARVGAMWGDSRNADLHHHRACVRCMSHCLAKRGPSSYPTGMKQKVWVTPPVHDLVGVH